MGECGSRVQDICRHLQKKHAGGVDLSDAEVAALGLVRCGLCLWVCRSDLGVAKHVSRAHAGQAAVQPAPVPPAPPDPGGQAAEGGGGLGAVSALVDLSLTEVARLPAHRAHLGKQLKEEFGAALKRVCVRFLANPQDPVNHKLLFMLPKIGFAGYCGKDWRTAATSTLAAFPDNITAAQVERARNWVRHAPAQQGDDDEERALADRVRRAEKAAANGSIRKAAAALWSGRLAPHDEETLVKLQGLHPAEPALPARAGAAPAAPTVPSSDDAATWKRWAKALPAYSAPGPSGWTYELICAGLEVVPEQFRSVLVTLFTGFWNGTAPLRDWWLAARLIALDKGNAKVRPIACGDALYRFSLRALLLQVNPDAMLPSWQLGVKVKGGIDAVVHLLRRRLKQGWAIVELDITNAFNTISRHRLVSCLEDMARGEDGNAHAKAISRAVDYAYRQPSRLLVSMDDGTMEEVESSSGVRQGDPMAMLLFAVGLAAALADGDWAEEIDGLEQVAIVDDLYILIPPPPALFGDDDLGQDLQQGRCSSVIHKVREVLAPWNLVLNVGKCHTLVQADMEAAAEARRVLGAFVGDHGVATQSVCDEFLTWTARMAELDKLPRQLGLLLLRWVVLAGVGHFVRVMPPSAVRDAAEAFDHAIEATVARWVKSDLLSGSSLRRLRGALRHDGLGLRSVAGLTDVGYSASLLAARQVLVGRDYEFDFDAGSEEDVVTLMSAKLLSSTREALMTTDAHLVEKAQHKMTAQNETRAWLRDLVSDVRDAKAKRAAVQLPGSGVSATDADECDLALAMRAELHSKGGRAWMRAVPTSNLTRLSDVDVEVGVAAVLAVPGVTEAVAACTCGALLGEDAMHAAERHALACPAGVALWRHRHDLLRDLCAAEWTSVGEAVAIEAPLGGDTDAKSDVHVVDADKHIDIAVVSCPTPGEHGFHWPDVQPAVLAAAVLTGMSPDVRRAFHNVRTATKVVQTSPTKQLPSLRPADEVLAAAGAGAGDINVINGVAYIPAREALAERREALSAALRQFHDEVVVDADHGSPWAGLADTFMLAVEAVEQSGSAGTEDDEAENQGGAIVAHKELAHALARPEAAAHDFSVALERAALGGVLRSKAQEKQLKGCIPCVLSARGSNANQGWAQAWPRSGADADTRNKTLSCILLKGARLLQVRMRSELGLAP